MSPHFFWTNQSKVIELCPKLGLLGPLCTGTIDVCPGQPDLQASGNIVMQLLANIPRHKGHKLFIDNWYTDSAVSTINLTV